MDFWASLEHKIYYKYDRRVPESILDELRAAAATAHELDVKMERLHDTVVALDDEAKGDSAHTVPQGQDPLEALTESPPEAIR